MAASRAAKVVPASPEPTEALSAGPADSAGPAGPAGAVGPAGTVGPLFTIDTSGANGNAATNLESVTRTGLVSGHSPATTPMAAAPDVLSSYRSGDRASRERREKKYAALLTAVTRRSSQRAKLMSVQGVVFAFTFMMSTFETSNRTMIIIVLVSIVGQYGLEIHEERGAGTELACYGAFLLVMGGVVLHAVRSLEEAEAYKKAFGVAFAKCAEGIVPDSDRLGPRPLSNPYLVQADNASVDFYMAEAARLYEAFQRDVLDVLSDAADPTGEVITVLSNLKQRERVEQKMRLDYNGVAAKVKDYLRATFVVTSFEELRRVWAAVEQLTTQGKLDVLSIKNRFRAGPTSMGYRDINLNVGYAGHVCEIQIQLAAMLEIKQDMVRAVR